MMWCKSTEDYEIPAGSAVLSDCSISVCEERLAVIRNKSVSLHDRETLSEILQLNFESEVNCVRWTDRAGRFLLVAEHSGLLHTVHTKSEKVINSERLYQTYNDVSSTFLQIQCDEKSNLVLVLGSDNMIHCFLNMDYQALDGALCEGSMQKAMSLRQNIIHTTVEAPAGTSSVISDFYEGDISILTIGSEQACLSRIDYCSGSWSIEAETCLYGYGDLVKAFKVTPQYLLSLTSKGHLVMWSLLTYTAVKVWSDKTFTGIAALNVTAEKLCDCRIAVSTSEGLSVMSLPSLEISYTQQASHLCISDDYTGQLMIHYLCGGNSSPPTLSYIAQISPEARYDMMINRQQYDEALVFAKKHSLNIQLVYEAKARLISHNLTISSAPIFRSCLDQLTDIHTVVDLCMTSRSSIRDITSKVLKYALLRLEAPSSQHSRCQCDRMRQVLRSLQMFHTYSVAYDSSSYSVEGWLSFLHCDLSTEVQKLARSQSTSAAMTVWSRHKCELAESMTTEWFDELLKCLDTTQECGTVTSWLSEHITQTVDKLEITDYAEILARHVERLARDYELTNKESWPDNSLTLCSVVDEIKSPLLSPTLARLRNLRGNLISIKELKDTYKCVLSYSQYCQQTRESIVYRLLDVVAVPSMFRQHYENIARLYMSEYCINSDKNLLSYVQDLIERYQYIRGYDTTGLLWEQKAVEVVECITQPSYKLQSVILLAKYCQVPWSKCITQLVEVTCESLKDQDNISELCDIRKRSLLSHLLSSYNIPREVIPTPKNALMMIRYILKKSESSLSGLEHALQVGRALMVDDTVVYLAACHSRLASDCHVSDILSAVRDDDTRGQVVTRLLSQAVEMLSTSALTNSWDIKQHWAEVIVSVMGQHSQIIDAAYFHVTLSELTHQIKAILTIKNEYGIELTLGDISNLSAMEEYLRGIVNKNVLPVRSGGQDGEEDRLIRVVRENIWSFVRFGHLTSLSVQTVYRTVTEQVSKFSPTAIPQLQRVFLDYDKSTESCEAIYHLIREIVVHRGADVRNATLLYDTVCRCISHISDDTLIDVTSLHNHLHFHNDVMSNCLGGGDYDSQDMTSVDCATERAELERLFMRKYHSEKDLIVNTKSASETSNALMCCVMATRDHTGISFDVEDYESYMQLLTTNSHDLLSIRLSLLIYYSKLCQGEYNSTQAVQLRNQMSSSLKGCTMSLLTRLMTQRNLDVHVTLSAILDLPISAGLSLIKKNAASFGAQFIRILALTNVALVLCSTYKQEEYGKKCLVLKQDSIWGYILNMYGVNFLPAFGKLNKSVLLSKIATKCPLEVIDKYISDYGISLDTELTYLTRVQHLSELHSNTRFWSHDHSTEGEGLIEEIQILLAEIPVNDLQVIENLIENCNPYNYRLIRTLLSKCGDTMNRKLKLLDFLSLYKRHTIAGKWEVDYVKQICGDNHRWEEVSKYRLPYQPLISGSIWKIIKAELNVKTFRTLQPVASLLDISTDNFLLHTALQIAESHIGQVYKKGKSTGVQSGGDNSNDTLTHNWCDDEKVNNKFFDDIMTVLAAIQDKKSAVMCCQSLVDKLPSGVEKVLVTKICVDLTHNWRQSLTKESEDYPAAEAFSIKITTMYTMLAVEQVLYQHNLGVSEYLTIIEHPTRLIQNILESTHPDTSIRADEKFEACCHVADLTGRDIRNLCYNILDTWLSVGTQNVQASVDMDMTMTIDMGSIMAAALDEQNSNQCKASSSDKEKWIVHLANSKIGDKIIHLLNSNLNRLSTSNKTKLLVVRCFLLLGDTSLASLSDKKSPSQYIQLTNKELSRQYKALRYIDRLQALNINMTVEDFYTCDLNSLIARLNKNYSNNPTAIDIYADLVIETKNYEISTWRSLLQQIIQQGMYERLVEVLMVTCNQSHLWSLDIYRQAWKLVYSKSNLDKQSLIAMESCPILDLIKK